MLALLYSVQRLPVGKISIMARPRGGDWLLDEIKALHESSVDVLVSCLTPEEEMELEIKEEADCCDQEGITYLAFPIQDSSVPPFSANTFSFLEQLHTHLSQGEHIAMHRRQGLGRAVLMAASLLVLVDFPPDQAFDTLSRVRGCPVPETEEQRDWVVSFSQYCIKAR